MAEKPEDLYLPTAIISRIIKEALPEGGSISKEARLALSRAATVFILYATSTANDLTIQSRKKTITAKEVLEAMKEMEFDNFIGPLEETLTAYRKEQKGKKEASVQRKKNQDQKTLTTAEDDDPIAIDNTDIEKTNEDTEMTEEKNKATSDPAPSSTSPIIRDEVEPDGSSESNSDEESANTDE